jgi:hypothetical protein
MSTYARTMHRELDAVAAEAEARDGGKVSGRSPQTCGNLPPDFARPIRTRTRDFKVADNTLLKAARLWAKTSQKTGKTYYIGRWGGCRVLILENDRRESEDGNTHWLLLGEADDRPREGLAGGARQRGYGSGSGR